MLHWNKALSLDVPRHIAIFNPSDSLHWTFNYRFTACQVNTLANTIVNFEWYLMDDLNKFMIDKVD